MFETEASFAGKLLIAMPGMDSPGFHRSVILLCAHNAEHAMGLVLNRQIEGISLAELLDQLGLEDLDSPPDLPILAGGPVGLERGFVLHSDDYDCEGATVPVIDGVCLTANQDVLHAVTSDLPPEQAVLALGYAGWDAGQLEQELADNVWLIGPACSEIVFDHAFDTKWTRAVSHLGVSPDKLCAIGGQA